MKKKVIYVNFIKKRKINFLSFIIYRITNFIYNKFYFKSKSDSHHTLNNKRISN